MIILKSEEEIGKLRISSKLAGSILSELAGAVKAGIKVLKLEEVAIKLFKDKKCIAAFKGYNGFPAHICVSVNDTVVHGIPDGYILEEGDIVSIDVGVLKDGYYGDVAGTYPVGKISSENERLIRVTRDSLYKGIENAKVGNRLFDISYAVQNIVENAGFSVVRDFVGHGIGQEMHEDPQIPNFGNPHTGPVLKHGMVLAIEPMVNQGTYKVFVQEDRWAVKTRDHKNSAHFEHTIAVLNSGPEILSAV
jgi:methionyl aminopeptidase